MGIFAWPYQWGGWILERIERLDRKFTRVVMHLMRLRTGSSTPIHPKNLLRMKGDEEIWFRDFLKGLSGSALDLGAGSGAISLALARAGFQVRSLELNPQNIRTIESFRDKYAEGERISVLAHDLESSPYPIETGNYDVVVSCDVVEHLHKRHEHLMEAARALKPGGLLFLAAPNRSTSWKKLRGFFGLNTMADDDHKIEYTREELLEALRAAGFHEVIYESPVVIDAPINGLLELAAPFSLSLYSLLIRLKAGAARWFPKESSGFRLVLVKR